MKYVPGLMVGQLSGKAGSTVASRGRFGSYFRTRNMPTNPNSPAQQIVRDRMSYLAKAWADITDVERGAWDTAAATIAKSDSLGVTYFQSGFDYFVGQNSYLSIYTGSNIYNAVLPINAPPTVVATAVLTFTAGVSASLVFSTSPLPAGIKMVVEMTAPMSPGRKYIRKSDWRQIFITAAAAATPVDVFAAYEARFGDTSSQSGKIVNFRVYKLDAEGNRSAYTTNYTTII